MEFIGSSLRVKYKNITKCECLNLRIFESFSMPSIPLDRKVSVIWDCSITRGNRLLNIGIIPVTRRVDKCSNFADVTTPFSLDDRSFSWRDFDALPPAIVLRFTERRGRCSRRGCGRRGLFVREKLDDEGYPLRFMARHTLCVIIIPLSRQSLSHRFDTHRRS